MICLVDNFVLALTKAAVHVHINTIKLDDGKSGKKRRSNNTIFYFVFHLPFGKGIMQRDENIILKYPT